MYISFLLSLGISKKKIFFNVFQLVLTVLVGKQGMDLTLNLT